MTWVDNKQAKWEAEQTEMSQLKLLDDRQRMADTIDATLDFWKEEAADQKATAAYWKQRAEKAEKDARRWFQAYQRAQKA